MRTLVCLLTALLLVSCSNTPTADRREWQSISCSGFADWRDCYRKANNRCTNHYEMANREENLVTQERTMLISCK